MGDPDLRRDQHERRDRRLSDRLRDDREPLGPAAPRSERRRRRRTPRPAALVPPRAHPRPRLRCGRRLPAVELRLRELRRRARAATGACAPRTQESVAVSADGERWFLLNASPEIRAQIEAFPGLWPRAAAPLADRAASCSPTATSITAWACSRCASRTRSWSTRRRRCARLHRAATCSIGRWSASRSRSTWRRAAARRASRRSATTRGAARDRGCRAGQAAAAPRAAARAVGRGQHRPA